MMVVGLVEQEMLAILECSSGPLLVLKLLALTSLRPASLEL